MRARGIKPGFWKNEDLAECSAYARLLYIGLWSMCDWEGRAEFRLKRIKAELFPYNDDIDLGECFLELRRYGFVVLYDDAKHVYVPNFTRHQNPHKNEREIPSKYPEPTDTNICPVLDGTGTEQGRNLDGTARAVHCSLFIVPCMPEAGTRTEDDDTESLDRTDSVEVKIKPKPTPDLVERRAKVIAAYNLVAERMDWYKLEGKPNKVTLDLINKFCEDEYRFSKLDEFMGKATQSTMEACRIDLWMRKRTFNNIMNGNWLKKQEPDRRGALERPAVTQETLDLSKPWNRPPEPEKRRTGVWDQSEGII